MNFSLQPLSRERYRLAENILWDEAKQILWWTDIEDARLWCADPVTGSTQHWVLPQRLGNFALTTEPDVLLLGLERQLARFDTRSGQLDLLDEVEPELPQTIINDGRCDRHGNFVFSTKDQTLQEAICSFYRYTREGELQRLDLPKAVVSNSICFSPDGRTMYFADSFARCIMACDYDGLSGEVSGVRVFARTDDAGVAFPDGATVDAEGYVWSAQWDGARVVRYAPDGHVDLVLPLPVGRPTCPTFAGPSLEDLCIATAHFGMDEGMRAAEPLAGAIFYGRAPRGRGVPEARYGAVW